MGNKRLIITSTISIVLVAILLIGSTYSIFTSTEIDEKENVYTTGILDITYTLSEDNVIMEDATPTPIEDSVEIKPYRITVTNNGNVAYKFNVILNDTTASNKIDNQYIMTQVGKLPPKLLSDCSDNILKADVTVLPNTSVDIDVRVWLYTNVQNSEMGKSFYGALAIDGLAVNTDETEIDNSNLIAEYWELLMSKIKKDNPTLDTSINFSDISSDTNGKGLYIRNDTNNSSNPIYYYRGEVTNNNVIFADMCFKIVRTTENGGIKLIYNGLPTNGQCTATGASTVIGSREFNADSSLAYSGYMYGTPYLSVKGTLNSTYKYGSNVTYTNGTYTLTGTQTGYGTSTGIKAHNYTCESTGTTCKEVHFIYRVGGEGDYSQKNNSVFITLKDGKKIEDAISEMLDNNTTSSTIKGNKDTAGSIDHWYYTNIEQKGYSTYLEDTVWCNDRSINSIGGWSPTGDLYTYLYFSAYDRLFTGKTPSLVCEREVDRFTVSNKNGNGSLDYPVGLLTADEAAFAGGVYDKENSTYYLNNGTNWWVSTPHNYYDNSIYEISVLSEGTLALRKITTTDKVRPAISLKSTIKTMRGTGTKEDPYVIANK